ncbi:MAG TPA: methyltransferase domain-containing protein [Caldimonas sp.]|jgi:SAM-dependent methyltransferase|nr:methyltransferase domain-containing protein [Caldimonas sp.]HEX2541118.1 methyltransferase domain-containing protein [Caldimonas sp.]
MSQLPRIHLCIQQPTGYVHSLGLLDQARYFRYQFRRLGAEVSLAKNRLHHDAVNFVFGAHLGFEPGLRQRHACVFVNLEQLGEGGAAVAETYLRLLATSAAVDYDAANVAAYAARPDDVPVVPLLHAPYLLQPGAPALEDRPIDLLFIGSMNERRLAWLDRIRALGRTVQTFESALYAAERDAVIVQAKAVVNAHFYETSRFEQARVAHCLSLGTPVIAERTPRTQPHPAFEDCVFWLEDGQLEQFFAEDFGTPAFYDLARQALRRFHDADPIEAYADLLAFAAGFGQAHAERKPADPWRPTRINLGSGKDYKGGWLNLDVLDRTQPDLLLDLAGEIELPLLLTSATVGPVRLDADSVSVINANNVLEHVPDLPRLMGNCLALLAPGGEFHIEVPYERAPTAWQDPTHVRAMNENSWLYYTDWFWYLGWFEHRFTVDSSTYLDAQLKSCGREGAAFMRLVLRKVETTAAERTTARTLQSDLRLPEDAVTPHELCAAAPPRPEIAAAA